MTARIATLDDLLARAGVGLEALEAVRAASGDMPADETDAGVQAVRRLEAALADTTTHEWDGRRLRLRNLDGTYGEYVNMEGLRKEIAFVDGGGRGVKSAAIIDLRTKRRLGTVLAPGHASSPGMSGCAVRGGVEDGRPVVDVYLLQGDSRGTVYVFKAGFGGAVDTGESFSTVSRPDGLAITEQDPNQLLVLDDSSNTVNAFGLGGGAQLSTINLGAGDWEGISSIGDRVYVLENMDRMDGAPLATMKVWGLDGTRYAGEDLELDVALLTNENRVRNPRGIAVTEDNIFVSCQFTHETPSVMSHKYIIY